MRVGLFAARGRFGESVGALDRFGPGKKPFARVGQSVAGVALVEETAVQLVFKRLNVARHRRVFRAELLGCSRKRARPRDRQKVSKVVPILAWLPVSHRWETGSQARIGTTFDTFWRSRGRARFRLQPSSSARNTRRWRATLRRLKTS